VAYATEGTTGGASPETVIWRFLAVLLSRVFGISWHLSRPKALAAALQFRSGDHGREYSHGAEAVPQIRINPAEQ